MRFIPVNLGRDRIDAVIGEGPFTVQAYSPVKDYRSVSCFRFAESRDQWVVTLAKFGFDIERVMDDGVEVQIYDPRSSRKVGV